MGSGTVYEELDEAKANIENLKKNYKIKLELSETLKRSYNEQLIKNQEAILTIDKLSQEVNEKSLLLEEAIAENEKLKENYQMKVEYSESLRKAYNEEIYKNHEAVLKIEKLTQELNERIEEIFISKEKFKEIKVKLEEKEALVKHLTGLNDKIRAENKDMITKREDENLRLGLALEEANSKNMEQEQLIKSFQEEINRYIGLVTVSKSSCLEKFEETRQRDNIMQKTEEEKNNCENQLKWKKEQFNHLQEAHEKIRSDFRIKEREWENEKASFLDELSIMQTKLDSQIRLSESLKTRLEMCNDALSHAESKRKLLEIELSESRTNFDNVYVEFKETKSTIEHLTSQRDQEIAILRCSLIEKENLYREMEYQVKILEQEKKDLISSLQEFQETPSSFPKKRNKIEQGLEAKEPDSTSKMDALLEKLNCCNMELNIKIELIDKLNLEIETRDSMRFEQQGLHNEEVDIMFLVLKSELSAAKHNNALIEELDVNFREAIEHDFELNVWKSIAQELKTKLEEEESVQSENRGLKNHVKKLRYEIDRANEELAVKFCEGNEVEFQLQIWKSIALQLNTKLEENHELRRRIEASLLAQTSLEINSKQEKHHFLSLIDEKDKNIHILEQKLIENELKIDSLHQDWDKVVAIVILKEMEIQEKNLIFMEMENVLKMSSNRVNELCDEDMKITERLDCIMQAFDDEENELDMKFVDGNVFYPIKVNKNVDSWPKSSLKYDSILDQRCHFREINN